MICSKCQKREAAHDSASKHGLCCFCFVESGRAPADWHKDCMIAWYKLRPLEAIMHFAERSDCGIAKTIVIIIKTHRGDFDKR